MKQAGGKSDGPFDLTLDGERRCDQAVAKSLLEGSEPQGICGRQFARASVKSLNCLIDSAFPDVVAVSLTTGFNKIRENTQASADDALPL